MVFTVVLIAYAVTSISRRPVPYFEKEIGEIWLGNIEFDFLTGLYFLKVGKQVYLRGSMPDIHQMDGRPTNCGTYNRTKYLCANWYPKVKLEVENVLEEHASCQVLTWTTLVDDFQPHSCFSMSDVKWYGGSLMSTQHWPLNKAELPLQLYQIHNGEDGGENKNTVQNVMDWFWISSAGVAVIADSSVPLQVSVNQSGDKLLCLHSQSSFQSVLKYSICKAENLRKIQRYVISKYVKLHVSPPNEELFTNSSWSTYPVIKNNLEQTNLLKYALEVKNKEFDRSFIDVNDMDSSLLRKELLDKSKFPNSDQSFMYLREYGFKVFLSVSPFVPVSEQIDQTLLVSDPLQKPLMFKYNGVDIYVLNLVNKEAVSWLSDKMRALYVQYFLAGFHLHSDLTFLRNEYKHIDTDLFTRNFASVAVDIKAQTVSSFAIKSQSSHPLILLSSKVSSWGYDGGLRSVIPSALTLGILGYPYIIPNIVGGPGKAVPANASGDINLRIPDRELYIRWLSIAAYMPCMMFSFPPWLYDEEVVSLAKQFIKIHKEKVAPLVYKASREFEVSGKYM